MHESSLYHCPHCMYILHTVQHGLLYWLSWWERGMRGFGVHCGYMFPTHVWASLIRQKKKKKKELAKDQACESSCLSVWLSFTPWFMSCFSLFILTFLQFPRSLTGVRPWWEISCRQFIICQPRFFFFFYEAFLQEWAQSHVCHLSRA